MCITDRSAKQMISKLYNHRVITEAIAMLTVEDALKIAFNVTLFACKVAAWNHIFSLVSN